jgi:hypothetical protein
MINSYQTAFLLTAYAALAYGAYREHRLNKGRGSYTEYCFIVPFYGVTCFIASCGFIYVFLFLGAFK